MSDDVGSDAKIWIGPYLKRNLESHQRTVEELLEIPLGPLEIGTIYRFPQAQVNFEDFWQSLNTHSEVLPRPLVRLAFEAYLLKHSFSNLFFTDYAAAGLFGIYYTPWKRLEPEAAEHLLYHELYHIGRRRVAKHHGVLAEVKARAEKDKFFVEGYCDFMARTTMQQQGRPLARWDRFYGISRLLFEASVRNSGFVNPRLITDWSIHYQINKL